MLQVGTPAPDFTLSGSRKRTVTLSKRGSPYAVIAFYIKNNTPG